MQLDAVRLGSALLGRLSVPDPLGLEKIGWLETQVMELKDLPSGWKVGYAGAYRTSGPRVWLCCRRAIPAAWG